MSIDVAPVFSDALTDVVATVSGYHMTSAPHDRDLDFGEITGMMNLCGSSGCVLFVSANEADIRRICSAMIGLPENEIIKDDILDTLCELVNMTAGSAKVRLSDTGFLFTLSQPFVITGSNMTIVAKEKTNIFSRVLSSDDISVKLKLVY
jgi:CheY-specific phosphatase CheX